MLVATRRDTSAKKVPKMPSKGAARIFIWFVKLSSKTSSMQLRTRPSWTQGWYFILNMAWIAESRAPPLPIPQTSL